MKCVQKANNEGCVAGTEDGVAMQCHCTVTGSTQSDIYLHIVMMEVFDSRTVPLKWNSIHLLL